MIAAKIEKQAKHGFVRRVFEYKSETASKPTFPRDEYNGNSKNSEEI